MNATPRLRFTQEAEQALESVRILVVPTDLAGRDCVATARHAAANVAVERTLQVLLYDRSHETWMDHPHPSGPHTADVIRDDHPGLADQLDELASAGIDARAWISTVPSRTEIITAIQATGADAVLLPDSACDTSLIERLTGRDDPNAELAGTIDRQLDQPVAVLAMGDGVVDVVGVTAPGTAR